MTHSISGHVADGFGAVADAFAHNFDTMDELGAGFAVFRGDECLVDLHGGFQDRQKTRPWQADTLIPVYSTTKPISALVVMKVLDDRTDFPGFETPMAEIWPEFDTHGKGHLTIAQILSHQAGLSGFCDPIDPALWLDPPALSAELAALAPLWPHDGSSGYHPLTWGYLAGEIVRRLCGRSLGTVLREDITHPDGQAPIDFWIGLPPEHHARCADIQRPRALPDLGELNEWNRAAFMTKWASPDRGGPEWRQAEIPSANGHGTARSVAQLYQGFNTPDLFGRCLTSSETLHGELTRRRTFGPDRVLPFRIEFAAGVMRNSEGFYGPNPNALGHSGWGGSAALADPDTNLSMAYVMNRQSNKLQGDPRARALFEAAYASL